MDQFVVSIPRSVLREARSDTEEINSLVRKATAIEYYLHEDASLGYCAKIAHMTEEEFIGLLGEHHICIFDDVVEDELTRDLENVHNCCIKHHSTDCTG